MKYSSRKALASLTILSLVLAVSPVIGQPSATGARLEGLLLGVDGKPVEGFSVLLIDETGTVRSTATTESDGMYRFRDLRAGSYGLGLESPDGAGAAVRSEPTKLADGQLVRMDIKLLEPEPGASLAPGANQKGLGVWYAGLTRRGKILTWVAVGVLVTTTVIILADDEDDASPIIVE